MEFLETQDPEKIKLLETSDRHRQEMTRELKDISERSEKILKNALIIGGVLALTYLVVNQVSSSKRKKKAGKKGNTNEISTSEDDVKETPSLLSKMGDKAMSMATLFLLDLAKDKLSEFLQQRKSKDENS